MPRQSVWHTSRTWLVNSYNEGLWLDNNDKVTYPGVAGVEEHGDGRDVEDREHHGGDLHTEEGGGDHQLRGARHEPDGQQLEWSSLLWQEVIIIWTLACRWSSSLQRVSWRFCLFLLWVHSKWEILRCPAKSWEIVLIICSFSLNIWWIIVFEAFRGWTTFWEKEIIFFTWRRCRSRCLVSGWAWMWTGSRDWYLDISIGNNPIRVLGAITDKCQKLAKTSIIAR